MTSGRLSKKNITRKSRLWKVGISCVGFSYEETKRLSASFKKDYLRRFSQSQQSDMIPTMSNLAIPNRPKIIGGSEQKFDCPMVAISVSVMISALIDYWLFGKKRHRQRCKTGRDWMRENPKRNRSRNFVPKVYQDLREKVEWLHSRQFYLMCEVLRLDEVRARSVFLRLLAGPDV